MWICGCRFVNVFLYRDRSQSATVCSPAFRGHNEQSGCGEWNLTFSLFYLICSLYVSRDADKFSIPLHDVPSIIVFSLSMSNFHQSVMFAARRRGLGGRRGQSGEDAAGGAAEARPTASAAADKPEQGGGASSEAAGYRCRLAEAALRWPTAPDASRQEAASGKTPDRSGGGMETTGTPTQRLVVKFGLQFVRFMV